MTKVLSAILAGVFFFSSLTGMGRFAPFTPLAAQTFDLEDDDFDDEPAPKKSSKSLDDLDFDDEPAEKESSSKKGAVPDDLDDDTSDGSDIAVFYFFADSTAADKGKDIARTVGNYLKDLPDYRFIETEARFMNPASDKVRDDIEQAEKLLKEGRSLNEDAEAESALGKLNGALAILEKRIESLYDYNLLSQVLFDLGATWKLLEEDDKAKDQFLKLLAVNPDFEAPENTDEDTLDFYDKLKSNMLMQPLGDLRATSDPVGATLYLDGKIVGMTPAKIEGLTAGKHYWRLHKNGYRDAGGVITIRDGAEAKINETLSVAPDGARIVSWEKDAAAAFGSADMMKKAVDIGIAAKVGRLALFHTAMDDADMGTAVKVQMRLINPSKATFKEESISFSLPARGEMSRSDDLRASLDNLFTDKYGFNPVSTILSGSLSTDGGKKRDGDGGIVAAWWFWTIIGVGVASAVTLPLLLVPGSPAYILDEKTSGGASMTIQFGN